MKKIISVALSVILAMTAMPLQAFAGRVPDDLSASNIIECLEHEVGQMSNSQALIEKARDDLENLESVGFTEEMLAFSQVTSQGELLYSLELPNGAYDLVSVSEDDCGNLTLDIYEGDIHDVLTYKSDGSLYVNGNEIGFEEDVAFFDAADEDVEDTIELCANSRSRSILYSTSPFVAQNTYTKYKGEYSYSKGSWGTVVLQNAAVATIAGILATGIATVIGVSSLPAAVMMNVALAIQSEATVYGMKDAYYSFKFSKYQSTASPVLQYDYKYTGACYSRKDYGGTKFAHTFYESNIFT